VVRKTVSSYRSREKASSNVEKSDWVEVLQQLEYRDKEVDSGFFRRFRLTQIVFISLFTSLLGIFIILVAMDEAVNSRNVKNNYRAFTDALFSQLNHYKQKNQLDWLVLEKGISKGIKITFDPHLFDVLPLFYSGKAQLNSAFIEHLNHLVKMLNQVNIQSFPQRYLRFSNPIQREGYELIVSIKVEGHSDSIPLRNSPFYKNNLELSTYRAFAMARFLRQRTGLHKRHFSIAGFDDFHPVSNDARDAINRRVEIYVMPTYIKNI
jgi:chemotaxis protein MotB